MAHDAIYDVLFEPVQIGPKTTPNRFFSSAALQQRRIAPAGRAGCVPRHEG